eukprot:5520521-Pleurochrysis_carterae.AAC.1
MLSARTHRHRHRVRSARLDGGVGRRRAQHHPCLASPRRAATGTRSTGACACGAPPYSAL